MESHRSEKKRTIFWSAAAIILMVCIFGFSTQSGTESNGLSMKVTKFFAELLFFRFDSMDIGQQTFIITELNFFIRKLAHFTVIQLSEWLFIRLWYLRALSSDTRGCARLQYVHCMLLPMKYTSILCQNEQCV